MFRTGLNIKSVVFLVLKPSQLPIAQHVVFKSAACLVRPWPYFSLLFENSYGRQVAAVFIVGILYSNFLLLAFIVMISHQKHRLQFLSPSQVYPPIIIPGGSLLLQSLPRLLSSLTLDPMYAALVGSVFCIGLRAGPGHFSWCPQSPQHRLSILADWIVSNRLID